MKVLIEDAGPCRKKVRIEMPAEEVTKEYEAVVTEFARTASVPGFRPGRAPRQIIERRYGKSILGDLRDRLVPRGYRDAVKQEKIDAVSILDLEEPTIVKGQSMSFTVTVDVPPVFDLPTYQGIPLTDELKPVSDEQVNAVIERLRAEVARYEEVKDRPVAEHDMVQVDYEATLDGQPLEDAVPQSHGLGKARDFWITVEDDAFLAPLGTSLKGAAIGEAREVDVPFREGFPIAELVGKTGRFRATVKTIRVRILPAADDPAFLKSMQASSAEELRERLRADMERAAKADESRRRRNEISRFLLDRAKMDLPQSLVQSRTQRNIYNFVRDSTSRGVAEKDIRDNKERIFQGAQRSAEDSLKLRYILHRIADAEKIEVTPAEVDAEIQYLAGRWRMRPDQARARIEEDNGLTDLIEDLKAGKALDLLESRAKIG